MFVFKKQDNLSYLEIEEFNSQGVKAFFSTRLGGVSQGNFASLNLAFYNGDQPERVLANRKIIAEKLGFDYRKVVTGQQVHGNKVYLVKEKDGGKGALDYFSSVPGVDALITAQTGIPLISFYADCVPLYFMDPGKKVVALAHAGWKGTVQKIALKTVAKMQAVYNVQTKDLWAALGPAISRDHYEVDEAVISHFRDTFPNWQDFVVQKGRGRYLLDLWEANESLLLEMGIPPQQIIKSSYCTYKNEEYFYSYRRDQGVTGRQASIIFL